jgi:phosphate-selective porin
MTDTTVGLNWYLNASTMILANYVHSSVERIGDADIFQIRFQLAF